MFILDLRSNWFNFVFDIGSARTGTDLPVKNSSAEQDVSRMGSKWPIPAQVDE